jgi:hypothetical protein
VTKFEIPTTQKKFIKDYFWQKLKNFYLEVERLSLHLVFLHAFCKLETMLMRDSHG